MGVGCQSHASATLPEGKTRYPLYRRLGGPQGWSGQVWKISLPTRIQSTDRPARSELLLPTGKSRYPFYRRLGGPQSQSGWADNLVPTRIRSQTVQPVVSHYTD